MALLSGSHPVTCRLSKSLPLMHWFVQRSFQPARGPNCGSLFHQGAPCKWGWKLECLPPSTPTPQHMHSPTPLSLSLSLFQRLRRVWGVVYIYLAKFPAAVAFCTVWKLGRDLCIYWVWNLEVSFLHSRCNSASTVRITRDRDWVL